MSEEKVRVDVYLEGESQQEAAQRLKDLLTSWDVIFKVTEDSAVCFTFALSEERQLEANLRAILNIANVVSYEILVEFDKADDGSRIEIRSERFEECIERALDWGRTFGNYEIKIVG